VLEVDVRLAAGVDGDHLDRATGERPGPLAGVVVGDPGDAPSDGQVGAGKAERSGLGFDPVLADLVLAVEQREDPG